MVDLSRDLTDTQLIDKLDTWVSHVACSDPCYSKCGSWPSSTGITWELVRNADSQASLVAQWLGVRLPMQGTRVRALVREDPTCRGAAGLVSHGH